jgi:hypothetical protein
VNGEDLRPLAERSRALEDKSLARLGDVHARIAIARRRRRSTVTLLSVASVLVVLAVTLVLIDADPNSGSPDPVRTPSPSFTPDPSPASSAAAHRPAEGTCWAVPARSAYDDTYWQDDSPQVPCGQEHTTETVVVLALTEPTAREAERRAVDMCWNYVRLYVGIDERSWIPWGMAAFLPSEEQIADGASWIRCDATFPDLTTAEELARARTGSAAGLADDPPPDYWACSDGRPTVTEPAVPCAGPHAYEQTGRLALLSRLDAYPTKQERETAAVQCEAGIPPRLRGYGMYIAWDPRSQFEQNGDVAGVCFVHDPSGSLPARPAGEAAR